VPLQAENDASAELFLPEFIHRFLPDRKSLESLLDTRFFSRVRRLSLEITLALMLIAFAKSLKPWTLFTERLINRVRIRSKNWSLFGRKVQSGFGQK